MSTVSLLLPLTPVFAVSVWRMPDRDVPAFACDGPTAFTAIDQKWESASTPELGQVFLDFYCRRLANQSTSLASVFTSPENEGDVCVVQSRIQLEDYGSDVETTYGPIAEWNTFDFGMSPLTLAYRPPTTAAPEMDWTAPATVQVQWITGVSFSSFMVTPPRLGLPLDKPDTMGTHNSATMQVFDTGIVSIRALRPQTSFYSDRLGEYTELPIYLNHSLAHDPAPGGGFDGFGTFHTGQVPVRIDGASDRDGVFLVTNGRVPLPLNISSITLNLDI